VDSGEREGKGAGLVLKRRSFRTPEVSSAFLEFVLPQGFPPEGTPRVTPRDPGTLRARRDELLKGGLDLGFSQVTPALLPVILRARLTRSELSDVPCSR
jgi:hypothetical protein